MPIEDLPARALEAEIARRLFGFQVEPRANLRTGEQDFVYAERAGDWVRVPTYTAGIRCALAMDVALEQRGWKRTEPRELNAAPPGDVAVVLEHKDGRRVEATGWLNLALCRAALKAVGG